MAVSNGGFRSVEYIYAVQVARALGILQCYHRTLYTLISNYRVRCSKAGEHAKAIRCFGGAGRPDQGRNLCPIRYSE
jgi:hypothetical protein